jgi:hypothetical protein
LKYLVFEQAVAHAEDAVDAEGLGEHGAECQRESRRKEICSTLMNHTKKYENCER